jgi:hypothetical protein
VRKFVSFPFIGKRVVNRFSAKFVTKRESVLLSELEALARMGVDNISSGTV